VVNRRFIICCVKTQLLILPDLYVGAEWLVKSVEPFQWFPSLPLKETLKPEHFETIKMVPVHLTQRNPDLKVGENKKLLSDEYHLLQA
jgi:hypothetical protein